VTGWINFVFCITVNYYQLTTLVEVNEKVVNISGLVIHSIFFLFLLVTLGQPNLLCLKQLIMNRKRNRANEKINNQKVSISKQKHHKKPIVWQPNPKQLMKM
jgi:hypothetical protein